MYYILLFLLLWFLLSNFHIKIKNIKDDTNILFSFGLIIKLHFDYDKFVEKFNILKEPQKMNVSMINSFIRNTFLSKKLYDSLCSKIVIEDLRIYKKLNIKNNNVDLFNNTMYLISCNYINTYITNKFNHVKNYEYQILRDDDNKNEYDYLVHLNLRCIYAMYIFIRHFKSIIKMIKNMRENNGQSSAHTSKS